MAGDVDGGGDTLDAEPTIDLADDDHREFFEASHEAAPGDPADEFRPALERDDRDAPADRDDRPEREPVPREGNGSTVFDPMATASLPPVLPALSGRIDSVHTVVSGLSVRLESLGAAIGVLQSDLLNSIADHSDLMTGHVRSTADAVEGYRRGTERLLSDVRREASAGEETTRRLVSRVEDLATDLQSVLELLHDVVREVKQTADIASRVQERSGESPSEAVQPALDQLARIETALRQPDASIAAVSETLERVERAAVPREWVEQVIGQLQQVEQTLAEATVEPDEAESEFSRLEHLLTERLDAVELAVNESRGNASNVDIGIEIARLREEVTQLKRRIGVRGRTSLTLDDDQIGVLAEQIAAAAPMPELPEAPAAAPIDDDFIERVTDSLVRRLETMFEVVPDPEPAPSAAKATRSAPAPASSASKSARSAASKPRGTKR